MSPTTERAMYAAYSIFGVAIGALVCLRRWVAYQSRTPKQRAKP